MFLFPKNWHHGTGCHTNSAEKSFYKVVDIRPFVIVENKDETPLFPHPPLNNQRGTHEALEAHLHTLKRNILNDPGNKIIKIYMR